MVRLVGVVDVIDHGSKSKERVDFPDLARLVCNSIRQGGAERGIMLCGTGLGAAIGANKIPGIRAGVCHDVHSAHQGVEHDNMNILCLGARIIGIELAVEVVTAFLEARFSGEERHCRRLEKILAIERQALQEHKS